MFCKYCRREGVQFDGEHRRYECPHCHLSSHNFDTIVFQEASFDNLPVNDVVIEATLDKNGEPNGFIQRYIPDAERVPELKVDIERARLLRHLLQNERREEKEYGYQWLRDNGFEIVDETKDRRRRKIFIWEKVK